MPRACVFSRSSSASVTGDSVTRLPMTAFGSAAVASYACFCWSLVAYSSWTLRSSERVVPMAWVAAESAV
ncbi:hypothetical protein [Micromonospora sp. U21]|uniref:hypothetical protein n=1 Tax=Micromonospora sp. U21 TaxID=2824899 RepID=UPI001B3665F3|nr:hypothetical protein [Micromonospora sp. U21]MBQ0902902.1 hypothetical protein [Micromonospora sp. U21]